ncbi:MAG: DMT family transporter, partial [Bacteroidota bacterium]
MPTLFIIIATLFWGASLPLGKLALQDIHATAFLFFRFSLATISMLPVLVWYKAAFKRRTIIQGVNLGLLQVGIMFLQTLGLKTISPSLSGFLTGFSIVFVLVIRFIIRRRTPSFIDIGSSLTCLIGLALLTRSYGLAWEPGVLYTLSCALFVALYAYALDEYLLTSNT